jgi:hypothetical protein
LSSGVAGVQELQEFRSYRSSGVTGVQELQTIDCVLELFMKIGDIKTNV